MKKYIKPELFHEQFELSQHVADCAWELTNSTKETCAAVPDPDILKGYSSEYTLLTNENVCVLRPGVNYEKFCYHGGAQGDNVFAS